MGNRGCQHLKVKRRASGSHACTSCGELFVSATAIRDARQAWLMEHDQGKNAAMVAFGAKRALTLLEPVEARRAD